MAHQIAGTEVDGDETERESVLKDDETTFSSEIPPSRQSTKYTQLMLKLKVGGNL